LSNAVTGYHLWSQTYDRDLGDVLMLQTEIAGAVASALKITLLDNASARIELGGTHDPAAFDTFLRARRAQRAAHVGKDLQAAIAVYSEAIRQDPNYALALANRSIAFNQYAGYFARGPAIHEGFEKAQQSARRAIALAPDLAEGHLALAFYFASVLDFAHANEEYERALALGPGNARVLTIYGPFAVFIGRKEAGINAARRAVLLDPLNYAAHSDLGLAMFHARLYDEALTAYQSTLALDPDNPEALANRGLAHYALGNLQSAQVSCEIKPDWDRSQLCLAMIYNKVGRHADAEAMLATYRTSAGDSAAYQYAEIYAQWGNGLNALEWLETALRLRDPGLEFLKTDLLLDPLRNEPRFKAVMRS
jgi:Tfp pilus assembly protein PilF